MGVFSEFLDDFKCEKEVAVIRIAWFFTWENLSGSVGSVSRVSLKRTVILDEPQKLLPVIQSV